MKGSTFLAVSVLLMWMTGLVSAQTMIPTTSMPISDLPTTGGAGGGPSSKAEINARITNQQTRIDADSKVGKLTNEQAKPLTCSLKKIKKQKKADYAENGKKELTSDQKTDLNNKLNSNEANLTNTNGVKNTN